MRKVPDFYLGSTDHRDFMQPRSCDALRRVTAFDRDDCLLIRVSPEAVLNDGVTRVPLLVVAPRFDGSSLDPISEWPMHVYVVGLRTPRIKAKYAADEWDYLAWGLLCRTPEECLTSGE